MSQLTDDSSLPQLPLPCLHSSQTRVFFGHERRLAEGKHPLSVSLIHVHKKVTVHTNMMKKSLSFSHSHFVPNSYAFLFSVEHKRRYLAKCSCCSHAYNESEQRLWLVKSLQNMTKRHKSSPYIFKVLIFFFPAMMH